MNSLGATLTEGLPEATAIVGGSSFGATQVAPTEECRSLRPLWSLARLDVKNSCTSGGNGHFSAMESTNERHQPAETQNGLGRSSGSGRNPNAFSRITPWEKETYSKHRGRQTEYVRS